MVEASNKTALFNPINGHLEQLFAYIDMGDLGIPDLQRPFVWKDTKVRDLFDSIYRGFPIGSYLLWRKRIDNAHQVGTKHHQHDDPSLLIIDGQQRLTALYAVFRGIPVKDDSYTDRKICIAFNPLTEEFKVADSSTAINPEFIGNISDLFSTQAAYSFTKNFINKLRNASDNLRKKHLALRDKIKKRLPLNKQDITLLHDKIKSSEIFSNNAILCESLGLIEDDDQNENSVDITELINERLISLSATHLSTIQDALDMEDRVDEDLISKRISKLHNLKNFPFNALEIAADLLEEQVGEIFIRINSKGTVLRQADFILTLLSVFWPIGRRQIDVFCMKAKTMPSNKEKESPFNRIFEPVPKDLVRIIAGFGFSRGRMRDAYALLTGRDFKTKKLSHDRRAKQISIFKETQSMALDNTNWHKFLKIILGLGFISKELISSANNISNAYILFLIAKDKFHLDHKELDKYIGRWFFFSSVTSRYSYSPESQMESDLNIFKDAKNKGDFIKLINAQIQNELTNDFWNITVPNTLLVSSSKKNPIRNAYIAGLIRNGVKVLFSTRKINDLFDPDLKKRKKDLEKHHIFPKNYLASNYKLGRRDINQVANFTYLEYEDNIDISDKSPNEYLTEIKNSYYTNKTRELNNSLKEHCIPNDFFKMDYHDFLKERRKLISRSVRSTFDSL